MSCHHYLFNRAALRLLSTETLAPRLQLKPCSGSREHSRSHTKKVCQTTLVLKSDDDSLDTKVFFEDFSFLFVFGLSYKSGCFLSIQGESTPTQRTLRACWGCGAERWSFNLLHSSGKRLTLCKIQILLFLFPVMLCKDS